jgi:hypothetical protein
MELLNTLYFFKNICQSFIEQNKFFLEQFVLAVHWHSVDPCQKSVQIIIGGLFNKVGKESNMWRIKATFLHWVSQFGVILCTK